MGEYQVQAAIAAVHDQAASHDDTDWIEILALYSFLERLTGNPMVTLNRAVAAAMAHGPDRGLALLDGLDERLGDHHRLHAVRAHLLEHGRRHHGGHRRVPQPLPPAPPTSANSTTSPPRPPSSPPTAASRGGAPPTGGDP